MAVKSERRLPAYAHDSRTPRRQMTLVEADARLGDRMRRGEFVALARQLPSTRVIKRVAR